MKHDPKCTFTSGLAQSVPADPIVSFISAHQQGVWRAARLLGGYQSARLVDRCVDLLAQDRRLTPQTRIMIDQILSVLSLERVDDSELPYMGYFARIDPSDPVVEEICLLTDGLRGALEEADQRDPFVLQLQSVA